MARLRAGLCLDFCFWRRGSTALVSYSAFSYVMILCQDDQCSSQCERVSYKIHKVPALSVNNEA